MIKTIAVIGAGTMGRGIAYASAVGGHRTLLYDVSQEILERALTQIRADLEKGQQAGKISVETAANALAAVQPVERLDRVREADLVIEAVPEDLVLKIRTLSELDTLCPAPVIFASNTSSLSVTEMAAATGRPDRVVGMHFFNPVPKMKLIEIVLGLETSPQTIQAVEEVARAMGKETVQVRESPGFITTRINALIGNEAFYMLQEGVASPEDIDKAVRLGLNHPMGPFEMVDLVGLDVRVAILNYLHKTLGEKYRPCPLMVQYVKAGRLGRKVGRGVYDYKIETCGR